MYKRIKKLIEKVKEVEQYIERYKNRVSKYEALSFLILWFDGEKGLAHNAKVIEKLHINSIKNTDL